VIRAPRARWLGVVPYDEAHARQSAHRDAMLEGRADPEVWGLEHPPVITLGRRAVTDVDPAAIRCAGFGLVRTERGGLATCHEPGQLVAYLLLDIRELGVRRTVAAIETGVIAWLDRVGVRASTHPDRPGVWHGNDKLCAIGLHVRAGHTMHGLALNLTNDLRGFGLITPCGITDAGVSSVQRVTGLTIDPQQAFPDLFACLCAALLDVREEGR
jgi:lipoate-protein ligase B